MDLTFNAINLSQPFSGKSLYAPPLLLHQHRRTQEDIATPWMRRSHHVAPELFKRTVNRSVRRLSSLQRPSTPALSLRSATMYSQVPGPRALIREDVYSLVSYEYVFTRNKAKPDCKHIPFRRVENHIEMKDNNINVTRSRFLSSTMNESKSPVDIQNHSRFTLTSFN
jgi:hypothetical protein